MGRPRSCVPRCRPNYGVGRHGGRRTVCIQYVRLTPCVGAPAVRRTHVATRPSLRPAASALLKAAAQRNPKRRSRWGKTRTRYDARVLLTVSTIARSVRCGEGGASAFSRSRRRMSACELSWMRAAARPAREAFTSSRSFASRSTCCLCTMRSRGRRTSPSASGRAFVASAASRWSLWRPCSRLK